MKHETAEYNNTNDNNDLTDTGTMRPPPNNSPTTNKRAQLTWDHK
jgi:hypothetical protein